MFCDSAGPLESTVRCLPRSLPRGQATTAPEREGGRRSPARTTSLPVSLTVLRGNAHAALPPAAPECRADGTAGSAATPPDTRSQTLAQTKQAPYSSEPLDHDLLPHFL